ncbi:MAG: bacillithiol system redox-active protein YtxJ [Saprospiraceae bacterium]
MVKWCTLAQEAEVQQIADASFHQPCLIFKHSTRCSISAFAKNRLESQWDIPADLLKPYYLDLIAHREVSNKVASHFGIDHESPQVLLIRDGMCVYDASHLAITVDAILAQLEVA